MTSDDRHEIEEIEGVFAKTLSAVHAIPNLLVEVFPILNYLPKRLARWKQTGDTIHNKAVAIFTEKAKAAQADHTWNWAKVIFALKEAQQLPLTELSYIIRILYEVTLETTVKTLEVFILAGALHPAAVKRAQEELDEMVGQDRMPTSEDLPTLPYTAGIPKGATVVANHWSLEFDDKIFEDPYDFQPERWLQNPNLPRNAFEFGRRSCSGEHLTRDSLFIIISRVIWGDNIVRPHDDDTQEGIDPWAMADGVTSGPMPFRVSFQVLSPKHQCVIEKEWMPSEKDTAEFLVSIKERMENQAA
ncbi:hypothetical protein ABOM_003842 [Aspergillus bombycis]|uniref:Cytochrome P450 n=1 Tax=Aspergillus bombycis TaxID=109264 RepID=A0A1F8A6B8_9EURO|nr:hypothetical protein ABOM_003842 [Aspergillus bombycis]OGM47276.1 hypothetical protein ABOM_003842 [Aspergillus bombycis]